jgi:hypothetical protein
MNELNIRVLIATMVIDYLLNRLIVAMVID